MPHEPMPDMVEYAIMLGVIFVLAIIVIHLSEIPLREFEIQHTAVVESKTAISHMDFYIVLNESGERFVHRVDQETYLLALPGSTFNFTEAVPDENSSVAKVLIMFEEKHSPSWVPIWKNV